jgi:Asp-tRNA(Asn)/Glu-tRNA(Gln) amidotransferase B subunit
LIQHKRGIALEGDIGIQKGDKGSNQKKKPASMAHIHIKIDTAKTAIGGNATDKVK